MTALRLVLMVVMTFALLAAPLAVDAQQGSSDAASSQFTTLDRFRAEWYSRCLAMMAEPKLLGAQDSGAETYRFLWLRSFHEPILARLDINADREALLTVKILTGDAACKSSERVRLWQSSPLSRLDVTDFLTALAQADYWNLPTADPTCDATGPVRVACGDGAQWVLEGLRLGTYRVVDRWSMSGIPYRSAVLRLLDVAGVKIDPVY